MSKRERLRQLADVLEQAGGKPTVEAVLTMHRMINPGFPETASRALQDWFGSEADYYVNECFRRSDASERLYSIRNAIKHGDISPDSHEDLLRLEGRIEVLWFMVWRIFAKFLGTFSPLDENARRDVTK
jgi:hypothetical protein